VRNWPALLWTSSLAQAEATREGVSWDPGRVPSCWPGALTVVVGAAVIVPCKWVFFAERLAHKVGIVCATPPETRRQPSKSHNEEYQPISEGCPIPIGQLSVGHEQELVKSRSAGSGPAGGTTPFVLQLFLTRIEDLLGQRLSPRPQSDGGPWSIDTP
jgi:hypothetical protein